MRKIPSKCCVSSLKHKMGMQTREKRERLVQSSAGLPQNISILSTPYLLQASWKSLRLEYNVEVGFYFDKLIQEVLVITFYTRNIQYIDLK